MKKRIITLFLVVFAGSLAASAQTKYCFENEGLKGVSSILFTISGNKVIDGEFTASAYDENSAPVKAAFKGTKAGKILTIKFTGKTPDEFSKIKKITWTLGKSLKVRLYGKNYQTNKWSIYSAIFTGCDIN